MTVPTINQGSYPLATPGADLYSPIIGANVVKGNQVSAQAIIIAQSGVASSVTGTTTETALASITIPGGMIGLNGSVRIATQWSFTNSANNKTPRVRFGGSAGTQYLNSPLTTSTSLNHLIQIANRGSALSQVGTHNSSGPISSSGSPVTTSSVDTSVDFTIVISAQLALGSEVATLERYTVEVLPA